MAQLIATITLENSKDFIYLDTFTVTGTNDYDDENCLYIPVNDPDKNVDPIVLYLYNKRASKFRRKQSLKLEKKNFVLKKYLMD